jgi:hypothetical protein
MSVITESEKQKLISQAKATLGLQDEAFWRWEGLVWDIFDRVPTDYNWGEPTRRDICVLIDRAVESELRKREDEIKRLTGACMQAESA